MILRRLGNKKQVAKKITPHFPEHEIYISTFFGAGGMYFSKPKVKHNILNDIDGDVFNLFQVVAKQKEELRKAFYEMPISEDLFRHWKKITEIDPIQKAIRFLFLSNYSLYGKCDTLCFGATSVTVKKRYLGVLDATHDYLLDTQFMNCDFREVFKRIKFDDRGSKCEK